MWQAMLRMSAGRPIGDSRLVVQRRKKLSNQTPSVIVVGYVEKVVLRWTQGRRSLWDRGDTSPPIFGPGGHDHECPPPQYLWSNISYYLSMQYFLDKLKEFLVFLVFSRLVQGVVETL